MRLSANGVAEIWPGPHSRVPTPSSANIGALKFQKLCDAAKALSQTWETNDSMRIKDKAAVDIVVEWADRSAALRVHDYVSHGPPSFHLFHSYLDALRQSLDWQPNGAPPASLKRADVVSVFKAGTPFYAKCIRQHADVGSDSTLALEVEFTLKGNGSATRVRLHDSAHQGSALERCVRTTVQRLPWPRFAGKNQRVVFPLTGRKIDED